MLVISLRSHFDSKNRPFSVLMLVAPEVQVNHVCLTGSKNTEHGDVGPCPVGV
jgi:hypothetical protein